MKIGIDMGHSISGAGSGAAGIVKETDKNREVGNLLISYLQNAGHIVVNCTVDKASSEDQQLAGIVQIEKSQVVDIFLSIHLNAFSSETASGTEVYIWNGSWGTKEDTRALAKKVCEEIANSCGFKNRGVKEGNYYVLRNTNCQKAMLAELCFCTSSEDVGKWNADSIAKGLFKALTGEALPPPQYTSNYRVGDHVKLKRDTTYFVSNDTVSPYDYTYKIVNIDTAHDAGPVIYLEKTYSPKETVYENMIYMA